jgi:signal peptidase II
MSKLPPKIWFHNIAIASVIAIFFSLDRWLKMTALALGPGRRLNLINHLLSFSFTPNYYMAFSLPLGGQALNMAVLAVVLGLLAYILYLLSQPTRKKLEIICLIIILSGALSNIWDRLVYGYVIDYLALRYFTVFNLADAMISGGALAVILWNLRNK